MKKVTLTKNDYTRIYKAITDAKNSKTINSNEAEKLLSELSKAEIVPSEKIDKDVVTMNSEVKLFFENTQKEQSFKIVYPQDANLKENKISIFSPIATASPPVLALCPIDTAFEAVISCSLSDEPIMTLFF